MIQNSPTMERNPGMHQHDAGSNSSIQQVCHYIEENPTSSILIGLGVGFGTGLALGALLRSSAHYFQPDESFAERLGHQMADSLANVLPRSLRRNPLRS